MHFRMSSAICFNFDQSKILSSGNELNFLQMLSLSGYDTVIFGRDEWLKTAYGLNPKRHLFFTTMRLLLHNGQIKMDHVNDMKWMEPAFIVNIAERILELLLLE